MCVDTQYQTYHVEILLLSCYTSIKNDEFKARSAGFEPDILKVTPQIFCALNDLVHFWAVKTVMQESEDDKSAWCVRPLSISFLNNKTLQFS